MFFLLTEIMSFSQGIYTHFILRPIIMNSTHGRQRVTDLRKWDSVSLTLMTLVKAQYFSPFYFKQDLCLNKPISDVNL